MVHLHVLSCLPLCVLALMGSAGGYGYGLNPHFNPHADQEQQRLQSELRPGTETDKITAQPQPTSPPILPPYLRLPMFRHQPATFPLKTFFRPFTGRRILPSDLETILVPSDLQPEDPVIPVSNNRGVAVLCGHSKIQVRVNRALLEFRSSASHFWLGSCPVSRIDGHYLFFMYDLNDCGSSISIANGQLIYSNEVMFRPGPQDAVIRAVPLSLPITCVYNRFHYSYKIGYVPELFVQMFRKNLNIRRLFSLSVCNERWEKLAVNESYTLGEPMYFEVSVDVLSNGESVFVEACHATPNEDPNSTPRHDVITNLGCLMDSRRTGSRSHFVLRQRNVLRFSLDAFLLPESQSERFYLHCTVSVGSDSVNPTAKSCTYSGDTNRWEELDGDGSVCTCCDSWCDPAGSASSSQSEQAVVTSEALSLYLDASQKPVAWQDRMPGQGGLQHTSVEEQVVEDVQEEVLISTEDCEQDDEEEGKKDEVLELNVGGGVANVTQQELEVEEKLPCVKEEEMEMGDVNVGNTNQENLTPGLGNFTSES